MPIKNVTRATPADFYWRMVLQKLAAQISAAEIESWLRGARLMQLPARHEGPFACALHVANQAQADQIETRYRRLITDALQHATQATVITLFITVMPVSTRPKTPPPTDAA